MTDTIEQLVQKPVLPAKVELFEVDCTNIPALNTVYYLTPMTDNGAKVSFGNQDYDPFPVSIEGLEESSEGAPARPTVTVANVNKLFGSISFLYEDLIGCKVTYIETFSIYLNSASRISAPPKKFTIAVKPYHDLEFLTFELRDPTDKERSFLPGRQMLKRDFPGLGINKHIG